MRMRQSPPGYGERHGCTVHWATWEVPLRRAVATLAITLGVVAGRDVGEVHSTDETG